MPRKRHTPEQIIGKLREAEVGLASGQTVIDFLFVTSPPNITWLTRTSQARVTIE